MKNELQLWVWAILGEYLIFDHVAHTHTMYHIFQRLLHLLQLQTCLWLCCTVTNISAMTGKQIALNTLPLFKLDSFTFFSTRSQADNVPFLIQIRTNYQVKNRINRLSQQLLFNHVLIIDFIDIFSQFEVVAFSFTRLKLNLPKLIQLFINRTIIPNK